MRTKFGAMPSANYIITDKMQRKKIEKHKQNLAKVTYAIDNKPPATLLSNGRPPQDLKRAQMQMERLAGIERSNRILFDKMAQIKAKRSLDNLNIRKPRSLNSRTRKEWLKRISKQNEQILERIRTTEPMYSTKKWEAEKKIHEAFINDRKRVNERRRAYMSNRKPIVVDKSKPKKRGKPRYTPSNPRSNVCKEPKPSMTAEASIEDEDLDLETSDFRPMSAVS